MPKIKHKNKKGKSTMAVIIDMAAAQLAQRQLALPTNVSKPDTSSNF